MLFSPEPAATRLRGLTSLRPTLAIVLGSGFQSVLPRIEVAAEVSYDTLAGFPPAGVAGHAGRAVMGKLGGTPVLVLSGRAHYYEGHPLELITFPVRVLAELGVRDLLLTNAAGGINRKFKTGQFMRLTDHINFMGVNPLRGEIPRGRERFVDLTNTYSSDLGRLLDRAARAGKVKLHRGVYLAVSGPSYETPAEIRAFAWLGADAVGMSTVPEAITARQCGLGVAAVSCITNPAAGLQDGALDHADVLASAREVGAKSSVLLETFAELYGQDK